MTARRGASLALVALLVSCPAPKHEYPDGSGLEGQLEKEIIACQQMEKLAEAKAADCATGGEPDPIFAELSGVVAKDVKVGHQGPITSILLPETHLFGADFMTFRVEAKSTLDLIATALQEHPKHTIVLEGDTADVAPNAAVAKRYPSLWDLGFARSEAVLRVLVDQFHLDETRFTLASRGPNAPLVSNDTAAGQQQNRRVVMYIYPPGTRH